MKQIESEDIYNNNNHSPSNTKMYFNQHHRQTANTDKENFQHHHQHKQQQQKMMNHENAESAISPPQQQRVRRCSYSQVDFIERYDSEQQQERNAEKTRGLIVHETFFKLKEMNNDLDRHLFLDDYIAFMVNTGDTEITQKIPIVGKKLLDLVDLYRLVQKHGGFEKVCQKRQLSAVVRELNLPKTITSAANTLRNQFARFLYRFECYQRGVRVNEQFLREQLDSPKPIKEQPHPIRPIKQEDFYYTNEKTKTRVGVEDMHPFPQYHPHTQNPLLRLSSQQSPRDTALQCPTSISPPILKRPRSTEIQRRKSYDEEIMQLEEERSKSVDEIYSIDRLVKRRRLSSYGRDGVIRSPRAEQPSRTEEEDGAWKAANERTCDHDRSRTPSTFKRSPTPEEQISNTPNDEERSLTNEKQEVPRDKSSICEEEERFESEKEERGTYDERKSPYNEAWRLNGSAPIPPPSSFDLHRYSFATMATEKNNQRQMTAKYQHQQQSYLNSKKYLQSVVSSGRHSSPTTHLHAPYPEKCHCDDCVQKSYYMMRGGGGGNRSKQSYIQSAKTIHNKERPPRLPYNHVRPFITTRDFEHTQKEPSRFNNDHIKPYHHRLPNDYRSSSNVKLSTNPTEMNLNIKERTENALVISVVVDGIYYSGTLLTNIKR